MDEVDQNPRQKVVRLPSPPPPENEKTVEEEEEIEPEPPIEILGLRREEDVILLAVRFPGTTEVAFVPSMDVREKSPIQLVRYYEAHLQFT